MGSLKKRPDTYLSGHGLYRFQPFRERSDFERIVADKKVASAGTEDYTRTIQRDTAGGEGQELVSSFGRLRLTGRKFFGFR